MVWKPRLDESIDVSELDLDAQEGFLLSRLDGSTSVNQLPFLTGLPKHRIDRILDRLVSQGTLTAPSEADPGASPAAPTQAAPTQADPTQADPTQAEKPPSPPSPPSGVDFDFDLDELGVDEVGLDQDEFESTAPEDTAPENTEPEPEAPESAKDQAEEAGAEDVEPEESADEAEDPGIGGNWRALFERELKPLEVDARVERARHASDATLNAFCYDPSPRVITALLENQRFGLEHARRVAANHRTGGGLDALGRRPQFTRDRQVQRNLFRNSATPQALVLRIFQAYRLAEIYRLTAGREATSRVRSVAKKQLRKKFPQSSAEERVQLILKTEGRCLPQLVGIALGGRATALLCRRPLASTLLIRNLARWPSTPPPVLQHMARQPSVRRSPLLRNEILRHPNAPSRLQTELRT